MTIRYQGDCLHIDRIPYIKGHPPGRAMQCGGAPSFNPLKWFH